MTPGQTMPKEEEATGLLSDAPTVELLERARSGDLNAVNAILQRCLPSLKRFAHGKLPQSARGYQDTNDLVQDAALNAMKHLDTFEPRHVGAMQAYLRRSVINRICDEVRRVNRNPPPSELPEDVSAETISAEEVLIGKEAYERYRQALTKLNARDRELIVARIEVQWTVREIAQRFNFSTEDAARMATTRALRKLTAEMAATIR
jgi:RNA polymerase sigma-70 factor, ECF subfamily